jgi:hypothetical protein
MWDFLTGLMAGHVVTEHSNSGGDPYRRPGPGEYEEGIENFGPSLGSGIPKRVNVTPPWSPPDRGINGYLTGPTDGSPDGGGNGSGPDNTSPNMGGSGGDLGLDLDYEEGVVNENEKSLGDNSPSPLTADDGVKRVDPEPDSIDSSDVVIGEYSGESSPEERLSPDNSGHARQAGTSYFTGQDAVMPVLAESLAGGLSPGTVEKLAETGWNGGKNQSEHLIKEVNEFLGQEGE